MVSEIVKYTLFLSDRLNRLRVNVIYAVLPKGRTCRI